MKKDDNEYPFNASFQFNKLYIWSSVHGRLAIAYIQYEGRVQRRRHLIEVVGLCNLCQQQAKNTDKVSKY